MQICSSTLLRLYLLISHKITFDNRLITVLNSICPWYSEVFLKFISMTWTYRHPKVLSTIQKYIKIHRDAPGGSKIWLQLRSRYHPVQRNPLLWCYLHQHPPAEPPSIEVQARIYIKEQPSLDEKPDQMTWCGSRSTDTPLNLQVLGFRPGWI